MRGSLRLSVERQANKRGYSVDQQRNTSRVKGLLLGMRLEQMLQIAV